MPEAPKSDQPGGSRSSLVLKTIELQDRRTSLKLEPLMWAALERVCEERGISPASFITEVEQRALASSLTSAVRVALLEHFWKAAEAGRDLQEAC